MPGYKLIDIMDFRPHKPKGIVPAENVIGILDFLREIADDGSIPFPKFSKWQVVGLEEVLFAAKPREAEVAAEIHARLDSASNDLQKRLLDVQVVFTGKLVCGAHMTVEYCETSLPIYMIFNRPNRMTDTDGNPFYPVTFHLSSANP